MRRTHEDQAVEPPCVWVSAGVLSYRPCDREFDCERCPLYQALRSGRADAGESVGAGAGAAGARAEEPVGRHMAALSAGCTLHLDRACTAEGLWLEADPSGTQRVGLDDYTLRLLHPVSDVVLPRPGVWMRHGAPCAWVNRGRIALALRCPVAGEVVEVNPRPMLAVPVREGVAEERWWFRVLPHEPVAMAAGLFRDEALLGWYLGRVRAVRAQLEAVMTPAGSGVAGLALADGGIPELDLEIVLGRERFDALLGTLFPLQR